MHLRPWIAITNSYKLCRRPPQYVPVPPLQIDLWPFDHESRVRGTCDVGYLCANFSLPRPLCSRLRPNVRDRQTDVRRASPLNASALWERGIRFHYCWFGVRRGNRTVVRSSYTSAIAKGSTPKPRWRWMIERLSISRRSSQHVCFPSHLFCQSNSLKYPAPEYFHKAALTTMVRLRFDARSTAYQSY